MKHNAILALVAAAGLGTGHAALIAHYNMEQTGSPLVDQVGDQQAAATGSGHAYSVAGPTGFGNAVDLTNNGSWQITAAESAELRALSNDFTVAAWINVEPGRHGKATTGDGRFDRIIGDDVAWDADGWSFGLQRSGTNTTIGFTKNGIIDINSTAFALAQGTWIHVAATVSSTAGVTFYLNGTAQGTTANTANLNNGNGNNGQPDAYAVGRSYGTGVQWFPGSLDEVRVYDTVLTQTEIAALMTPAAHDPLLTTTPLSILVAGNNADTVQPIKVTVTNDGATQALEITGIAVTGEDAGLFTVLTAASPGSPVTLTAGGGTGMIELSFNPGGNAVIVDAQLEITSNDSLVPVKTLPISGTIRDPRIDVPTSVTVPATTTDAPLAFDVEIYNAGETNDLTLTGASPTGTDAAFFQVTTDFTNPVIVPPGGSTLVSFSFEPNGQYRSFSASLTFESDDIVSPVIAIPVSATLDFPPPPGSSLRLTGNAFSGSNTGLLWQPGAPVTNDSYDNTAVPPSSWANIYYDDDNDQAFTSPGDTSGNTNYTLSPAVVVNGAATKTLNFYVQSFAHGATPSGVAANFAANAYRLIGWEMELSDGSVVPINVKTGTPQTFADPGGKQWTVSLNGVGMAGDVVSNINSVPGGEDDYHFTLTFVLGANFDSWAASNGIPNNPDYDAGDNDGIKALVEYGLGFSPTVAETLPGLQPAGADFTITWPKGAQAAADPEISYVVEVSDTLGGWVPAQAGDVSSSPTQVVFTLRSGQAKAFARLAVHRN